MKSICFLAANLQLKEKIEQVLTIATSQEQQTAIPFHVEVLNFPQRIEQAQKAIAQGADVIITNTGAHHDLSQVLKDVRFFVCTILQTICCMYCQNCVITKKSMSC